MIVPSVPAANRRHGRIGSKGLLAGTIGIRICQQVLDTEIGDAIVVEIKLVSGA